MESTISACFISGSSNSMSATSAPSVSIPSGPFTSAPFNSTPSPNDPKQEAITTVNQYYSIFHEESDPYENIVLHTNMCILEDCFRKIFSSTDDHLCHLFPQFSLSIYYDISTLFSTLFEQEWENAYNSILKFFESNQYSEITKLKSELVQAEDLVDQMEDEDISDAYTEDEDDDEDESDVYTDKSAEEDE